MRESLGLLQLTWEGNLSVDLTVFASVKRG